MLERQAGKKSLARLTGIKKMINYPVGDFLIRVKNSALARQKEFSIRDTKKVKSVAEALKKSGFLESVNSKEGKLNIRLSYQKKEPTILGIKLVTAPGRRIYVSADELANYKGPEILIVSTNKGVLSHKEAVKGRVGGELIASIW